MRWLIKLAGFDLLANIFNDARDGLLIWHSVNQRRLVSRVVSNEKKVAHSFIELGTCSVRLSRQQLM